ncbi:NUDIX domain-containing protein [Paraflavisolibacter sp. H34]|uniref:NUDIX domain-containing protein n=1 Tax=Huijunlia imazamoxiresistens TaxID=3127457 RepID=UPI003016B5C4
MQEKAAIRNTEILCKEHYPLKKITFALRNKKGELVEQVHEVYAMGNAAVVLLYNPEQKTVLLTRQFRTPALLQGYSDGMLIECCAGKIGQEQPEEGIKREIEEETGYQVPSVQKVFEALMSPAYVTEIIHFFIAEYHASMKVAEGGGLSEENEEIEVLEMPFKDALALLREGKIVDAKTIMLLQYAQVNRLLED